ncbi:hypothetical protein PV325_010366 [Microctonus aethiopoides]|nr:hypothetical protein PV325_010366 [Microctonus aethiopoides]
MFVDSCTVSDVNEAFDLKKLRNFNASSLPTHKSALLQQFLWDQLPNYVSDSLKTSPETDGEGDIENDEAMDWSSSDEDNEDIDDNEKNYLHHSIFLQIQ